MWLENLHVQGLRCLSGMRMALDPGINLLTGPNGSGKTSVLEAAFLLSHARSFRSGSRDALLQRGAESLTIFAELHQHAGQRFRLGISRETSRWLARIDGEAASMGDVVGKCAVVCFEPGSHALIAGGSEERRRYLDWGVFHVEHTFLDGWRRYQRALKQRNQLLRSGQSSPALLEPWEFELTQTSNRIDQQRQQYLEQLRPLLGAALDILLPELGRIELKYRRGWSEDTDLLALYEMHRGRDQARGHTTLGAHRADWSVAFEHAPLREHLSRGQEKLTALGCLLAQANLYAELSHDWPIICLDDLASELDNVHQTALVQLLRAADAQVLITGTEVPLPLRDIPSRLFHVEQGHIAALL